jgi:hypothetical protein
MNSVLRMHERTQLSQAEQPQTNVLHITKNLARSEHYDAPQHDPGMRNISSEPACSPE